MNWDNQKTEKLLNAVLALKNLKEAKAFFRDLLTADELDEFGSRWLAVQMLNAKVSYNLIQKQTRLSSRTIARISKWLKNGKGGYKLMLNRKGNHHTPFFAREGLS
jgi:TrpR-related protein YerC/YecD